MDILYLMKKEGHRRKFSYKTIKTYCFCVHKFLMWCQKEPKKVSKKDVRDYIEFLDKDKKSGNTLNVYLNSIKFMIEEILHKNWKLNIKYSKIPKKLPIVYTMEEIFEIINGIMNEKHRMIISLIYSAGLRVSEVIKLKINDFEFSNGFGWVRDGKGGKDRIFVIADNLRDIILKFVYENNLGKMDYLFFGRKGYHISDSSVRMILKKVKRKIRLVKRIHPHALRHSFATHIIEKGNDVCSLQSLLGHSNINTTMTYVHASPKRMVNVKSPYDDLKM